MKEKNQDKMAETLLQSTGFSVLDAARLALEFHELITNKSPESHPSIEVFRSVFRQGMDAYVQEFRTVSFREAVEKSLQMRAGRRVRTLAEVRQCCRRLLRGHPELADMPVRRITTDFCRDIITECFHTPTTRRKARRLLHAIFSFSLRRGWCATNPITAIDVPQVRERQVDVLSMKQIRCLLTTVRKPEYLACAPAVGLMLWAGIRPTELTRLRWSDVHVEDRVITIEACHAKTGGARLVTLRPVLIRWLRETAPYRLPNAHIVPRAWARKWRELRLAAGFEAWHPDALRHTFASYHLKHFGDYKMLQVDMGHADAELLRTRYLGMRGITKEGADEFWGKPRKQAAD